MSYLLSSRLEKKVEFKNLGEQNMWSCHCIVRGGKQAIILLSNWSQKILYHMYAWAYAYGRAGSDVKCIHTYLPRADQVDYFLDFALWNDEAGDSSRKCECYKAS